MIIGIDGNEANVLQRQGVHEYAFQLLWQLYQMRAKWSKKHRLIVYLQNEPLDLLPKATKNFEYRVIPGGGMWIIKKLMPDLYKSGPKPDVFFTPSHYIPPFAPMPRACSIMDLGYLKFVDQFKRKDFWQLKLWTAYSLLVSKKVFAISESTKKDIVRHYPFASKKIIVTPLGYNNKIFNKNIPQSDVRRIKNKYHIVNDYILFISTLKPSKNIEGLLQAWSYLKSKPDLSLVIAGKKGWLYDSIFSKVKELGLESSVIFTDFVAEEDKPALIAGAKILVLPSFWEGFGLDPLYAMACGTPVIVSNVGSLPEVVGEAGLLIDPTNPKTISKAILDVLQMNALQYKQLVAKGYIQARKFSWEKVARDTLLALEAI